MHDDLLDAVDWAVREKVTTAGQGRDLRRLLRRLRDARRASPSRPTRFACGVDIVGPSNLETLLATIPPYWKAFFEELARRVGDPRTEEGRKLLARALAAHGAPTRSSGRC